MFHPSATVLLFRGHDHLPRMAETSRHVLLETANGDSNEVRSVDLENLPVGLVGVTSHELGPAGTGPAIFGIGGSEYRVEIDAGAYLQEDQEVVVVGEYNQVEPVTEDVTQQRIRGDVGIENIDNDQIDPATEPTLVSVDSRLEAIDTDTDALATIDTSTGGTRDAVTNGDTVTTGQHTIQAADTPESITEGTATAVGAGKAVAVQALRSNAGTVWVGDDTVDAATGYPLAPGQPVDLALDDAADIHVSAPNTGDVVAWIVEADA